MQGLQVLVGQPCVVTNHLHRGMTEYLFEGYLAAAIHKVPSGERVTEGVRRHPDSGDPCFLCSPLQHLPDSRRG